MTMAARVGITPLSFTFVRATGGAIVLLLLATARHERFSLPGGERLAFAILVCVSAVVSISLNAAYAIAPVALVSCVFYLYPALIAIIASVRHEERLGRAGVLGVGAIVVGIALLALGQAGAGVVIVPIGIALAAMAAIAQTAYFRAGVLVRSMPPFLLAGTVLAASAVITLAVTILSEGTASISALSRPDALVPLVWAAVITAALAMTALLVGIRLVGATASAVIMLGEPITNAIAGKVLLGQPLPLLAVAGMALLVAGAARIFSRRMSTPVELIVPHNSASDILPMID
jgi:drug/metabolite transporter (DMT)-like permease